MSVFAAAALGLILGSFLNALLFRYNTGRSIFWARSTGLKASRSQCMQCGHTLGVADLVPVFSYFFLRGKCRYCHSRISAQYPLVEAAAGLLAAALYLQNPEPLHFAVALVLWLALLFIVVYDLRHNIIPWSALGIFTLSAFVLVLLEQRDILQALMAGILLAVPLFAFSAVSRGRWMGLGDGMLEFGLGLLLGLSAGASALVLAFWIGAVVGIALLSLKGRYTMKSEVPFAPFLVLGAACVYFLHVNFLTYLSVLLF